MNVALFALGPLLLLAALAQPPAAGSVCYRPNTTCNSSYSFAPYQLPFVIKEKLVFGKSYRSREFYAVILKSVKIDQNADCTSVSEAERLAAQTKWPSRKVFSSRYSCPEELLSYENTEPTVNFLGIYAGENLSEARRVLNQVKTNGFPEAYIKRMRILLDYST